LIKALKERLEAVANLKKERGLRRQNETPQVDQDNILRAIL
jgi:hypothetical protein